MTFCKVSHDIANEANQPEQVDAEEVLQALIDNDYFYLNDVHTHLQMYEITELTNIYELAEASEEELPICLSSELTCSNSFFKENPNGFKNSSRLWTNDNSLKSFKTSRKENSQRLF